MMIGDGNAAEIDANVTWWLGYTWETRKPVERDAALLVHRKKFKINPLSECHESCNFRGLCFSQVSDPSRKPYCECYYGFLVSTHAVMTAGPCTSCPFLNYAIRTQVRHGQRSSGPVSIGDGVDFGRAGAVKWSVQIPGGTRRHALIAALGWGAVCEASAIASLGILDWTARAPR